MKYAILVSLFFMFACSSENQKIEGEVFNEEGKALPEVMVQVMGTDLYTYTNEDGYFAINTKSRGDELIFNLDGYQLGRFDIVEDELMQITLKALPPKMETEIRDKKETIAE